MGAITNQDRACARSVQSVLLVLLVFTRFLEAKVVEKLFDTFSDDVGLVDHPTPLHAKSQACCLHSFVEALRDPVSPSNEWIFGRRLAPYYVCCAAPPLRRPLSGYLTLLWRS